MGYGLMIGGRLIKGGGSDRRHIHQTLSLAVIAAVSVHALALIADRYLHPSLIDVTVPFAFSYKPLATSIGIVAAWTLAFLGLSYYARTWIGHRRWKSIHRFTVLAWLAALVHTFAEGTDAGQRWFIALIVATAAPAFALLTVRLIRSQLRPAAAHQR